MGTLNGHNVPFLESAVCQKWSKIVAGANVTMYVCATFKLLSAEGVRQLASRSGKKINTIILPLKKKA